MTDTQGWEPEQLEFMRQELLPECRKKADKIANTNISNGYTFEYNGNSYTFDTTPDSLSKLAVAYNVSKTYKQNDLEYSQAMIMKDYKVVIMDRDSIITNYDNMISYSITLYSNYAMLIDQLNNMTYYELLDWNNTH